MKLARQDTEMFVQCVFDRNEQTEARVQSVPQPQHPREASLNMWGSPPLLVIDNQPGVEIRCSRQSMLFNFAQRHRQLDAQFAYRVKIQSVESTPRPRRRRRQRVSSSPCGLNYQCQHLRFVD